MREACEATYGIVDHDTRLAAASALAALELPVGSPSVMKHESVPEADALMP